jgi:hypothetical protein
MTTKATTGLAWTTAIVNKNRLEIAATPVSKPSSPSRKLIAFIMPTYHTSVSGTPTQGGKSIQFVPGL